MKRPPRSVVIGVVAAAAITGGIVAVESGAITGGIVDGRLATGCRPYPDHDEIIEQFRADPIVAAVPQDFQLTFEKVSEDRCGTDSQDRTYPYPISLQRGYNKVTVAYTLDQLHQLFDQPAAAGGWRAAHEETSKDLSFIYYCKLIGEQRPAVASVWSNNFGFSLTISAGGSGACDWTRPSPSESSGPTPRSFPVVDGPELHVVAQPTATLRPVGDYYAGKVIVDVYNSGRQPYTYIRLWLTLPPGVRWESLSGVPTQGGCGGSPAEFACNLDPIPSGGGRAQMSFSLVADIAPGSGTTTIDGFAVRIVAADANNTDFTDLTPTDNRVEVRLSLEGP